MPNITIDGNKYSVKDGLTIIEAIDQAKLDLPRYCYHPALSIAGNCRICQVEVEGMPRTVIACNTRVAEGMAIRTASAKAKESQKAVLEFLLVNHPLDCPVCDQAGECKLQDYYMEVGQYDPGFNEHKVKKSKKAFAVGPTIMLDQERCILCSRCVRFGDEVTKTHDFGIFNRGDRSELNLVDGKELDNKYSGNVADICPVGALTDRDFRFKMRVWYLGSQDSVCPGCARGCNTEIHFVKSRPVAWKKERVMRLKPRENPDVNRWWMCDDGRYGYKAIDQNRLRGVLPVAKALEQTAAFLRAAKPASWAALVSPQYTNEEIYLVRRLFRDHLRWPHLAWHAPGQEGYRDDFLIHADKNPNSAGTAEILGMDARSGDITPVLESAERGEYEGLFVFGHDLSKLCGAERFQKIRRGVRTLVYEGPNENPTASAADVVFPAASYAEKDGTFTNSEGRVQRIRKAVEPIEGCLATWDMLLNLGGLLGFSPKVLRPEHIFQELAREVPAFAGLDYRKIGSSGAMWKKP